MLRSIESIKLTLEALNGRGLIAIVRRAPYVEWRTDGQLNRIAIDPSLFAELEKSKKVRSMGLMRGGFRLEDKIALSAIKLTEKTEVGLAARRLAGAISVSIDSFSYWSDGRQDRFELPLECAGVTPEDVAELYDTGLYLDGPQHVSERLVDYIGADEYRYLSQANRRAWDSANVGDSTISSYNGRLFYTQDPTLGITELSNGMLAMPGIIYKSQLPQLIALLEAALGQVQTEEVY